ncbi:MAG: PIN domain-containing protein [Leptospiraceae bacterium]|nr:PIN domain-containing protein [Leptospiraceae bacterium]
MDTCIIIDLLKGKPKIKEVIETEIKLRNCVINDIVIMELLQGARNKSDLRFIQSQLNKFQALEINQMIMNLSKDIICEFTLSHNAKIQDAIIASFCIIYDVKLFTYNLKDFEYIHGIKFYWS